MGGISVCHAISCGRLISLGSYHWRLQQHRWLTAMRPVPSSASNSAVTSGGITELLPGKGMAGRTGGEGEGVVDLEDDDQHCRCHEQDIHLDGDSCTEEGECGAPAALGEQPGGDIGQHHGHAIIEHAQHEDAVQPLGQAEQDQRPGGHGFAPDIQRHHKCLQGWCNSDKCTPRPARTTEY